ncbi:MAG: hypothetical protein PVF43_07725, partial [Candidatus Eiseniibacteriota bacterium]
MMSSPVATPLEPLGYVCPECRGDLDATPETLGCPRCGRRVPVIDGVPHFVEDDGYWGEIPASAMRELLRRLHHQHWYAALAGHPDAAVRGKAAFIADQRRANWIYELPLDPTSRLLDVGCG